MSPSKEVDDADGQAPRRLIDVLSEKQQSLDAARKRYRLAKAARDEDAMSEEEKRIDALSSIIVSLETEVAAERETRGAERAMARLVGIKRAYGSVTTSTDDDEQRVLEQIEKLEDACKRLNDRYAQATQLRAEAAALSDRFDLVTPALSKPLPPVRREFVHSLVRLPNVLQDHAEHIRGAVELCEFGMRERRTYGEIAGTEGFEIITASGLLPWPDLTDYQQKMLAAKEREHEEMRRQFAGLPTIPQGFPAQGVL